MRLLKTNLSDDANKPFTKEEELRFMFTWKFMVRGCLLALGVPGSIADTVANDIKNSKYYDIVNYASMKSYLHYYGIAGIFDKNYRGVDVTNKMFYPLESSIKFLYDNHKKPLSELKSKITPENWDKFPREIGNDISDYLTDDVIVLPYKTIIDNQSNKFVDTINTAFNQQLNSQAKTYIADTFKKYINSQHQLILQNPKQYYHDSYILYSNALISLMSGNNE
jgi:hypothetical protein